MPTDKIVEVLDTLGEQAEKIGLYFQGSSIGVADPELAQKLVEGEIEPEEVYAQGQKIIVVAAYRIGDLAFSTRAVDPEQHTFDVQAQTMLPTPAEDLRERIKKAIEEGRDPFEEEDSFDIEQGNEGDSSG